MVESITDVTTGYSAANPGYDGSKFHGLWTDRNAYLHAGIIE